MSLSLADAKKAWLKAAVGYPGAPSSEDDITTLEFLFCSAKSGLTPVNSYTVTDHKRGWLIPLVASTFTAIGLNANNEDTTELELVYWATQGSTVPKSYQDRGLDFYLNHPYAGP